MVPKILSCFSFSKSRLVNGADAGIKGLIRDVKSNLIRLSGTHVVGFEFRSLQARKLLHDVTNFELSLLLDFFKPPFVYTGLPFLTNSSFKLR